jgi:ketosteroid isomerase-like protein
MRRAPILAFLAFAVAPVALMQVALLQARADLSPSLTALIEQERAFAKTSGEKGMRDAFLEFLADESLLFTPGPTPGKLYYKNRPAMPMKLDWAPEFADVSAGGDLGYTSGPYEMRRTPTDPPTSFGHFNSLWRLQKDGQWKVEVDLGISHEKPAVSVADVKAVDTPKDNAPAPKETKPITEWQTELVALDTELNSKVEAVGVAKALEASAADTIRVYRNDNLPAVGKAAALKLLASSRTQGWKPALARVAKSGDLGYSSGTMIMGGATPSPAPTAAPTAPAPTPSPYAGATPPTAGQAPLSAPGAAPGSATGARPPAPMTPHYYVRIWRRDKNGAWKIVLDVAN